MLTRSHLSWISHQELAGILPPRSDRQLTLDSLPLGVLQTEKAKAGPLPGHWDNLLNWGWGCLPVPVFPNHILAGEAPEKGKFSISHRKLSPDICWPYLHGNYKETAWVKEKSQYGGNTTCHRRHIDLGFIFQWQAQHSWVQILWEIKRKLFPRGLRQSRYTKINKDSSLCFRDHPY